ncbi:MAG: helix-hairpin-helix domain-containing protein [Phycisphaerales bacterium]|nr:helix-hairpin-helix domain-containing protein [Phycisphaerales bacterium]
MNQTRSGSAIVAVLLLVAIGVVMAASVLATADAASATARGEAARTQSRALAWSGVQGLMAELAEQRDGILDGEAPQVTPEWDLYTLDDGTRAVIRLVDLTPEAPGLIAPENAKLDLNSATAEMLAKVPGLDATLAGRIVAARQTRAFSSVEQLLGIEGIEPRMIYGGSAEAPGSTEADSALAGPGGGVASSSALGDLLTVFAFDPNVQLGLGGEDEFAGRLRVNLNQPWSDRLRSAITERMGDEAAKVVQDIMKSGQAFAHDADLVRVLRDLGSQPADWVKTLDLFTTSDDEFIPGRVDLNRAPPEVLTCLPGLTREKAAQIAHVRQTLDAESRRSPVWVVTEDVLTPDEFESVVDYVTTRSTQWRARIEVGFESDPEAGPLDAPMSLDELHAGSGDAPLAPHLAHHMIVDVVIDIASKRPRVAYLREVTLLEDMLDWADAAEPAASSSDSDVLAADAPEAEPETESDPELAEPDPWSFGEDFGGIDLGGDLDLGIDEAPDRGATSAADSNAGGGNQAGAAASQAGEASDRRIGRWTTRQGGKP